MALISLEVGLVLRRGARLLEFMRMLPDGKIQFEDQLTRQATTMTLSRFYAALQSKQLIPVLADDASATNRRDAAPPKLITDIASLPMKDQKTLRRRMAYVLGLRKRSITKGQRGRAAAAIAAIAAQLSDDRQPGVSTVLAWMRNYNNASCNPAVLLSGNRQRRRQRRVHPLIDELILRKLRSVYLNGARLTLRHAFAQIELAAKKLVDQKQLQPAEASVSFATVFRRLKEFRPYDVDRARYGATYARAKYRTTVEGVVATRVMQRLECDHTLLNWVVLCDRTGLPLGRPTLTVIIDSWSGYVVGIYVSFYGPSLTSVINALKNAIRPKDELTVAARTENPWIALGIGETLLIDNGLEFHSPQFQLVAWELGMDIEYCRVRTPWLKPKVERFFANLDHFSLSRGRVRKPIPNVLNLDPLKDAAITFTDFVKGLIRFVVDVYPFEPNSRRLDIPFTCFKEGLEQLPPVLLPTGFDQLDMIAAMSKRLTVAQGGVELKGLSYSSRELLELKRSVGAKFKALVKWNPDDLNYVYLQGPTDGQWMVLPSLRPDYTQGLSWIQHHLIQKHAKDKHIQGGGYERLLLAKQDLHELWMNPLARRGRSGDRRLLAKVSGVSSDSITKAGVALPAPRVESVLAPEDVVVSERDVPDFASFSWKR